MDRLWRAVARDPRSALTTGLSPADPRVLARTVARLWEMLPAAFDGIELSPVAPLGTCSSVATVDQNRVLTTMRGSEGASRNSVTSRRCGQDAVTSS